MEQHTCKNCGNEFTLSYCNSCGQKTAHRITMGHIWHDIVHAFTHADKGIFHLFFQLFTRPGIVAREYIIEGKRKRYFNPFQYILIIGSIGAFVAVNSHFMETTMASMSPAKTSERIAEFMKKVAHLQSKYYNIVMLLQLPFLALSSFLWFKKFRINYAEHLTMQTFIVSQSAILSMFMMFITAIAGKPGLSIVTVMSVFSTAYQLFAYRQFFGEKGITGILRGLASVLTGLFFFTVLVTIIMIVAVIILVATTKK